MVSRDLKRWVDDLCDTVKTVGDAIDLAEDAGMTARADLGMYMMYLSASDGQVAWQEAQVISEICEMNLSSADVANYIKVDHIYSEDFESTVPDSFALIVAADKALIASGKIRRNQAYSDVFINIYKAVGEALIKSDDSVTKNEVTDYTIYTRMLEQYQRQNI